MSSAPLGKALAGIPQAWVRHRENLLEDGQREPQQENKLEGEIEGEPVNYVHKGLNDAAASVSRKSAGDPHCQRK